MRLIQSDCLAALKQLEVSSIDAIITDPPYGLAFMGKKWDYDVPSVEIWKEVLRVLKPGGHLLSFGGTRTYHRMVVNIEDAGFEIRDQIQWIYGSGFPKSLNIKEGDFKGWGTALKPANEPIVLARKPLDGTVAENIEKWGVGGLNIDDCRIETNKNDPNHRKETGENGRAKSMFGVGNKTRPATLTQGRWPANVMFDEEAAEMLDEQSGPCKTGNIKPHKNAGSWKQSSKEITSSFVTDSATGASRFFYCAKASKRERNAGLEGMPLKKSTSKQQNSSGRMENGIVTNERPDEPMQQNHHPTVKPIKLMEYLCKLVTPSNGIILDPFMGSGSTGIAAKNLGFDFVGIERELEYFEIAKRRLA